MKKYIQFVFMIGLLIFIGLPTVAVMQEAEDLPLATRGSYHGGAQNLTFIDEQRDGRKVSVYLMYPAVVPEDQQDKQLAAEQSHFPIKDLVPDMSGAPYPVVLNSHWYQGNMGELNMILEPLVTRGFVVASLTHPDSTSALTYIDRPLDVLFVINQLTALNEAAGSDLAGLMDMDQIGVIGGDDGGDAALMVSGAHVDPEAASQYVGWYGIEDLRDWYPDWDWTAMAAYHNQLVPTEADDPLWPAMTDPRIRAVVAYMPSDAVDLLGERGLATATTPALVIGGTEGLYDWYASAYTNLESDERYLLTLIGAGHESLFSQPDPTRLVVQQFVTAFFGYHLQGKTEYAQYLTEDYAESLNLDNIIWGIDETALLDPRNIAEMTFTEGGTVAVGDTIAGEVAEFGARIGYRLTLDTETLLNLYVNSVPKYEFDSVMYVCDAERDVLFWNDEFIIGDVLSDAGFEGIELPAGSYIVIVRGWGHSTGSYELKVENVE